MNFQIVKTIIPVLAGFVIGCFISFLLMGGCGSSKRDTKTVSQTKELKQQVDEITSTHDKEFIQLENKNESLQQELKSTKQQLSVARIKTRNQELKIKKLIDPKGYSAKEILNQVHENSFVTSEKANKCDSFIKEINSYLHENIGKDSIYDAYTIIQDSIIAIKDSVIQLKIAQNTGLQTILSESLKQQDYLLYQNKSLQKKIKRQKARNKLITVGMMILSATATNYFLNH